MPSGRGGSRQGAGAPSKWNYGKTQTIRVPVVLSDKLIEIAKKLDSGKLIECDTDSNTDAVVQILEETLNMKANAGGAIKAKVKEAIALLKMSQNH